MHHHIPAMNFKKIGTTNNAGTKLTLTAIPVLLLQRLLISANMSLQKKSSNLVGHLSANVLDILRNAFPLRSFHL